jgi:hypothetical protein
MDHITSTAVKLIKSYFGESIGREYEKFYSSQNNDTIKRSITELLTEYLGEEQARKKLQEQNLL